MFYMKHKGQLNRKLAGEFAFRQDEMESILKLLDVNLSELGKYFFTPKVEISQH